MPPAAGSVRRCWGTDATVQLQVEPHDTVRIYWTNVIVVILLQYIATLTQDWQSTGLAQGRSVSTPAENGGHSPIGWTVLHSNDPRWM